jgi:hypothetical protein
MASFLHTDTSKQQHELEVKVTDLYQDLQDFEDADREEMLMLFRDKHTRYLQVHSQQSCNESRGLPCCTKPPGCLVAS